MRHEMLQNRVKRAKTDLTVQDLDYEYQKSIQ
jgi:hypothetical protein